MYPRLLPPLVLVALAACAESPSVIPPNPIRYRVSAQVTTTGNFLTDVTPVVTF